MAGNLHWRMSGSAMVLALFLAGCTAVESSGGKAGVAYSLPKGQVQFIFERKIVTPDHVNAAMKAFAETAALVTADEMALGSANKTLADLKGTAAKLPAGSAELTKVQMEITTATAVVAYLEDKVKADTALRDAAKKSADALAMSVGSMQETGTFKVLPSVPDSDRAARYVANFNHLVTRDDNVKLTVANGLLSSGKAITKDRTGDILIEIAKIASLFVGPLPISPPPKLMAEAPELVKPECKPYHLSMVINPLDVVEYGKLQQALVDTGSAYRLAVSPTPLASVPTPPAKRSGKLETDGLYYRAPISTTLQTTTEPSVIEGCGYRAAPTQTSASVTLPDTSQTYILPMEAGLFTTTTQEATFKDGMIASYEVDRPSEALAVAKLPIEIARAFMSIPTEFLKLRVDYDNAAVAETNAQVEQLKAQLEALKAAQALDAAEAGTVPTP